MTCLPPLSSRGLRALVPVPWGTGPGGPVQGGFFCHYLSGGWGTRQVTRVALLLVSTTTDTFRYQKERGHGVGCGDTWPHCWEVSPGREALSCPLADPGHQLLASAPLPGLSCPVPVDCRGGRTGSCFSSGRVHLGRGLVPLPVGRSCSSDPKWPWPTRATTESCAGSPRGPGAGESLPDAGSQVCDCSLNACEASSCA